MSTGRQGQLEHLLGAYSSPGALPDGDARTTEEIERELRPHTLSEFVGQEAIKDRLGTRIKAANIRGEPMPHTLLLGGAGLGKTTLALMLGKETGGNRMHEIRAAEIKHPGVLAVRLAKLKPRDILFVDEIHLLSKQAMGLLYPPMEGRPLIWQEGSDHERIDVAPSTIVGATTEPQKLPEPLRQRFSVIAELSPYSPEEMVRIVGRTSEIRKFPISEEAARLIGERSRGVPRIANSLFLAMEDRALARDLHRIDEETASETLESMGIHALGLSNEEVGYLSVLFELYPRGAGIESLCTRLGESRQLVSEYEGRLLRLGLIDLAPRGRTLTAKGREYVIQNG